MGISSDLRGYFSSSSGIMIQLIFLLAAELVHQSGGCSPRNCFLYDFRGTETGIRRRGQDSYVRCNSGTASSGLTSVETFLDSDFQARTYSPVCGYSYKKYSLNEDGEILCQSDIDGPTEVDTEARKAVRYFCDTIYSGTCEADNINVFCDTCEGKKIDATCRYMEKCRRACKYNSNAGACEECRSLGHDWWGCCAASKSKYSNGNEDVCAGLRTNVCAIAAVDPTFTSPVAGQSNRYISDMERLLAEGTTCRSPKPCGYSGNRCGKAVGRGNIVACPLKRCVQCERSHFYTMRFRICEEFQKHIFC